MAAPCIQNNSVKSSAEKRHWSVRIGGLISLKYLLLLNLNLIIDYYDIFFDIIIDCLKDPIDDVCGAAADVIKSLALGIKKSNIDNKKREKNQNPKINNISNQNYGDDRKHHGYDEKMVSNEIEKEQTHGVSRTVIGINKVKDVGKEVVKVVADLDLEKDNKVISKNIRICFNRLYDLAIELRGAIATLDLLSCRALNLCTCYSSTCWLFQNSVEYLFSRKKEKINKNDGITKNENNQKGSNEDGKDEDRAKYKDIILRINIILTNVLANIFFQLHLYCKESQLKCLAALQSGKYDTILKYFLLFYN